MTCFNASPLRRYRCRWTGPQRRETRWDLKARHQIPAGHVYPRPRRNAARAALLLLLALTVTVPSLVTVAATTAGAGTFSETTGGPTNTWTNYTNAGGSQGPTIASNTTVQIACKLTGFKVADGNTWWYQIASGPWNSAYYASADAFYNNGATSGSLHGTPFVDPAVPACSGSTGGGPVGTRAAVAHLAQGPAAPAGYRYAISLSGFAANSSVSITCYDSVSPGGFYTFPLTTNSAGDASTQSQCFSGDGPDHWIVAGGVQSNHLTWGSSSTTGGGTTPPPVQPPPPGGGGIGGGGPQLPPAKTYNREAATTWAKGHWNDAERFPRGDCTWFVSQALWAGGLKQTGDWTASSYNPWKLASWRWLPGPTKAAAQTQPFVDYVVNNKLVTKTEINWSDNTAGGAQLGDIIAYDWDPPGPDGNMDHLAIVTGFSNGYPLVSQHSKPRYNRGWSWDPDANNWIEISHTHNGNKPRVYLLHVIA